MTEFKSGRWQDEEALWTMGAAEFRRRLHPAALMVFGPTGILELTAATEMLARAPRWSEARLSERHLSQSDDVVVLAYRVTARREAQDYNALCSSVWVRMGDDWKLSQHQQTPAAP